MQICDRTKKRPFDSLFKRQTVSSKICCARRNRSVKNRRRDILRRWSNPPAVMSDATGRLSGATIVSPRGSRGKSGGKRPARRSGASICPAGPGSDRYLPTGMRPSIQDACRGQIQKLLRTPSDPEIKSAPDHCDGDDIKQRPDDLERTSSRQTEDSSKR